MSKAKRDLPELLQLLDMNDRHINVQDRFLNTARAGLPDLPFTAVEYAAIEQELHEHPDWDQFDQWCDAEKNDYSYGYMLNQWQKYIDHRVDKIGMIRSDDYARKFLEDTP